MKKLFTLLVVCTTFLCGLNAEVLLKDSFNYQVGDLTKTDMLPGPVTNAEWFYTTTTAAKIQVIDTALTFNGYCSNKSAKAIQFKGNTNKAVRGITIPDKTTSIYYSVLMNVHEIKNSTTKDGIIMMHNVNSSAVGNCWAQLRYLNDYTSGTYSLGISKSGEAGVRWVTGLPKDSTILVVVRYDIIEGDKNDEVYMWINPTKLSEGTPTSWCVQDTTSSSSNPIGANQKADAGTINRILLKPATHTPNMHLDEFRIATKWADLFEGGGGDEPELGISPTSVAAGYIFQGDEVVKTINVTGQKLAGDVTISNQNGEVALSTAKITKAAAEEGAEFTATIKANKAGEQTDTITLVSGTIIKKIPVAWSTIGVANCANIKALKDSVNGQEGWSKYVRLAGEAIVTRDTTISSTRELYIEDATGAAKITDDYSKLDADNLVGAKIKDFVFINGEVVLGVQPFIAQGKPTVVSTGNEVEPQVVTLATLQANAADYLLELVQVQKVAFTNAGESFTSGNWEISQDSQTANVKVEMSVGITGNEIPEKANVTGFSLNTSGSVIVPRGIADIVDASEVLLKNGSFEKYNTSSSPFGSATTFEDWNVTSILGTALAAETTDVLEGKAAFKTTSDVTAGYISQEINCDNYATGDQFNVRVCYKNLDTKDSAIVLDCYWESSMGSTEPFGQTDEMKQALPNSQAWDSVTFRVTKPEKAKYFVMKYKFKKKAQVLLDNLDFKYYEDTVPYFSVMPEKETYSFTANINSDTTLVTLTIRQRNLKQPVKLELLGTGKAAYSIDKTQVTAAEETVTIKFKTSTTGKFNATLNITDDESTETSLMNKSIWFYGTAIDPTKTPEIKVTPMEFDTFRCKAYEEVIDTIFVTSSNCSDYVRCWANEQTGPDSLWGFGISDSYLSKNETDTVILTFAPKKAGKYTARIKVFTTGTDTIFINVAGVAEEGQPEPIVVDWDTVFTWKQDKPYKVLNEQFNHADTCYNKTLKTTDWQNVVLTGQRPWWGYKSDSTKQAKITSYYSYTTPGTKPMENWLVTPALDYKNATKQVFTFRVMGWAMQEQQTAKLEVYYIDATDASEIWFQHIEEIDSMIPAKDSELNGQWTDVYLSLAGQEFIPDVFFMAFKFTDNGGTNGIVYYVDDVTWGVKDVPTDMKAVQNAECTMQNVHKVMNNGKLYIVKDGKRYNVLGQMQ